MPFIYETATPDNEDPKTSGEIVIHNLQLPGVLVVSETTLVAWQ